MQVSQLAAELHRWSNEFASTFGESLNVPDKLWTFLAHRLTELGVVQDDPDILTVRFPTGYRKVRITGKRGRHLTYEHADGAVGYGLIEPKAVHPNDRGRLTDIIERMVADGRIKNCGDSAV